jgi:hypothetical protein
MKLGLILLLLPFLAQAEYRMEGRMSLTEAGYEKLKKYVGSKVKIRMDYYIDAFDGDNFLLYPASKPVKFRVKHSTKKTEYQIVTKTSQTQHGCGNFPLEVSEKESYEDKLPPYFVTRFKDFFEESINAVGELDDQVLDTLQNFQSFAFSFVQVGNHLLDRELNGKRYILTPSHYARKHILKRDVESLDKGRVELSLRVVTDFDFNNNPSHSYEVEFEPENPELWTSAELAAFGCSLMELDRLDNSDVQDTRMDRRTLTIRQLRKTGF